MEMKGKYTAALNGMHETGGGAAHEMDALGNSNIPEMRGSDIHAELDGAPVVGEIKGVRDIDGNK